MPVTKKFVNPCHVVCEGEADREFLSKLAASRNLSKFDFTECGGKDGYGEYLLNLKGVLQISSYIKGILLVRDSNDNENKSFKELQEQLKKAGYPVPDKPLKIKNGIVENLASREVAVATLLIPWIDRKGNLETLIYEALRESFPKHISCLESFMECLKDEIGDWRRTKADKLRVNCLISATYKDDPSIALRYYLQRSGIPLTFENAVFDQVAGYLAEFSRAIRASS